jgi:hypothetical protein
MDYKKTGKVWCPVLKDYVTFNSVGIHHLLRKRGGLRPKREQKRRFVLLRYAAGIIGDPKAVILHQLKDNPSGRRAHFWAFKYRYKRKAITVVVRQFENGAKHFLSVY